MRSARLILVLLAAAAAAAPARADGEAAKPRSGSVTRQIMLKLRLEKISAGTLEESLNHNRAEWAALTPEQREQYRNQARAFLQKSPEEQRQLLAAFEKMVKLSAEKRAAYERRAKWLKVVVASFPAAQRAELQRLPADQRAQLLLERKAQLIREGKLAPDEPPAPAPTSQPAGSQPQRPAATEPEVEEDLQGEQPPYEQGD